MVLISTFENEGALIAKIELDKSISITILIKILDFMNGFIFISLFKLNALSYHFNFGF